MDKKDLKEILKMIKEKLESEVEPGCIFGDCGDCYDYCSDSPIYILPPRK